MRKNVKRTIAVLSAVCMLPCPQVANVAVMAQNVSVGSSIGSKILKQSLQTSTNFETASGKRQEVKENNIEDSGQAGLPASYFPECRKYRHLSH